jgi:hypothetical protein
VSLVDGLFEAVGVVGGVLVAAGLVMILMAWGDGGVGLATMARWTR